MSLVIFFGMALCIFTLGVVVIVVTLYRWYKLKTENKELPSWIRTTTQANKAALNQSPKN